MEQFYKKLKKRRFLNRFIRRSSLYFSISVIFLFLLIALMLFSEGIPLLIQKGVKSVIFNGEWLPSEGKYGLKNFIFASFYTTSLALIIAVPISILSAIFLSEYLKSKISVYFRLIFDVLSGVSPVIYGFWGVIVVVPFVKNNLQPFLENHLSFFFKHSDNRSGFSVLSASIVLAVMVSPLIVSLSVEVLKAIPLEVRQATMALGSTKWEMIRKVLLKKASKGMVAGIILSFSRSIGETFAVLMVSGCSIKGMPSSIFDPCYPLPALIANTFGETMSIPLYKSAIFLSATVLLFITLLGNFIGFLILLNMERERS